MKNLIDAVSLIAASSKGAGLEQATRIPELKRMKQFLNCTESETLLLCLIIFLSVTDDQPRISDIAKYLDQDPMELLSRISILRALQKKGLIRKSRSYREKGITDMQFYVPAEVFEALAQENTSELIVNPITDSASLFSRIGKLSRMVEEEIMSQDEYEEEVIALAKDYPEHYTIRNMNKHPLPRLEKVLLLTVCSEFVKGVEEIDLNDLLSIFLEEDGLKFTMKRDLIKGTSKLISKGLLRLENSFFRSDRMVFLTDRAIREMFDCETGMESSKYPVDKDIIIPGTIRHRRLFFNTREWEQLKQIRKFLSVRSYKKIIRELEKNNMVDGIAILFHGSPGTGKTEAVYQLARALKKPIFSVDISQTKNLFFGESEKEIKRLFDKYRKMVKQSPNCPILLFNEADGVLGKRKDANASNVAPTENAMQNIILQEMEQLSGIMIATTNLSSNLDKAFERRFLYKVNFTRPTPAVMARIWKDHIPSLKPSEASALSDRFPFSGGQIANIARKVISSQVIFGRTPTMEDVIRFCEEERLDVGVRRIGFGT